MEKNQQPDSVKNASTTAAGKEAPGRPGQALPTQDVPQEAGGAQTAPEAHSESSLPENDNETLGTP